MRAMSVTWPRAIDRLSASRTSPSHRDSSEGSFRLGLKKRWLTVRSSTLTRAAPTNPAAAPNPVMLRIMASRASYDAATTLSIPEVPSHTVDRRLARHGKARNELVRPLSDRVTLPPEQHRIDEPDLDQGVQLMAARRDRGTRRPLKRDAITVVMAHGEQRAEMPARELLQPPRSDVHLRSNLHQRTVGSLPLPAEREDVGVNRPPHPSANGAEHCARAPFVVSDEHRVEDDRRDDLHGVEYHRAASQPHLPQPEAHLSTSAHELLRDDVAWRTTQRGDRAQRQKGERGESRAHFANRARVLVAPLGQRSDSADSMIERETRDHRLKTRVSTIGPTGDARAQISRRPPCRRDQLIPGPLLLDRVQREIGFIDSLSRECLRREHHLRPCAAIGVARAHPGVGVPSNRIEPWNDVAVLAPLGVALPSGANAERIDTHRFHCPTEPCDQRQLVAATRRRPTRSVLLKPGLYRLTVPEPPSQKSAVEIRVLVTGEHIRSGCGAGAIDAPRSEVNAQLVTPPLHQHFLQGPQLDFGEVEQPSRAVVEGLQLDPIVEDPDTARSA